MHTYKKIVVALALCAAGSAHAFGIGVRAGTTGVGADVAWSVAPTLSARLGYSGLKWGHDVTTSSGVRYDGDLKLSNFNALLDFSPLGPFRLTGGFIFNKNKFEAVGNSGGNRLSSSVEMGKSAAPYLGVGYGNVSGLGINFYADLGIMFTGSPKASVTATCASLSAAQCSALAASERTRLEDELKDFKYWPVLNIGITVGF